MPDLIRVLSVPSGHVYVDTSPRPTATRSRACPTRARRASPTRSGGRRDARGRVGDEHADEFDVMHVHFGFDALSPDHLATSSRRCAAPARRSSSPCTTCATRTTTSARLHDAQLDVLVEAADAVITLTPGAAAEIAARWGREAVVAAAPPRRRRAARCRGRGPCPRRIRRRACTPRACAPAWTRCRSSRSLAERLPDLPGARLRVDAHTDVMTPGFARHDPELAPRCSELADRGLVDLHVHDYFTDDELWDYLQALDVSVLPYRFGTHSGWLEACHDLGTTVLAPDCGYYAEQRPCLTYAARLRGPATPPALEAAVPRRRLRAAPRLARRPGRAPTRAHGARRRPRASVPAVLAR